MKKKLLMVVAVVTAILLVICFNVWGAWVEPITGTATLVVAAAAWWEARRAERNKMRSIVVTLRDGEYERELPLYLTRGAVSRAEVLGRLGMLPMANPGARFSLAGVAEPDFLRQLKAIDAGTSDRISIASSPEEIDQFDWVMIRSFEP